VTTAAAHAPASAPWAAEQEHRDAYETAPCGYVTLRRDGTVLAANRTLLRWTGRAAATPGLRLRDLLTPASWAVFNLTCAPVLAMHGGLREIALDLRRADGATLPVLAGFQRLDGAGPDAPLIRGVLFDASERRLYERELLAARKAAEDAHARLSAVLEATTDGVLLAGTDGRIAYANPAALRLLPRARIGAALDGDFPADDEGRFAAAFAAALAGTMPEAAEGRIASGAWLSVRAHPAPGGGAAIFFRDATPERAAAEERRRNAERIAHAASHDALTGLPNRLLFARRLREALADAPAEVAVMCLDLDRFKQVNDRLGHPAGDALLRAVATRLRAALRPADTVARLGGDEFAIVLHGAGRSGRPHLPDDVEAVAARIIRALSEPFALGTDQAEIGTSIGIAFAGGRAASPESLLEEADIALYRAKRAGRGRHVVFSTAMMEEQRARTETAEALRQALEAGELMLHYQPVAEVATRAVRGHEALLRWDRPGHGLVPPAAFVAIAEEAGLIAPLGAFVLARACRDAADWPDGRLRVSVNLSLPQLRDPALVASVEAALAESGLEPARLELEVTEGVMLDRAEAVLATMHRLREWGVTFAMDDFGTGQSSLASLRAFPFRRVKIDRSFIRHAEMRDRDVAIIESVASLARRLGMDCTGEGVETEGQLALLARAGCTEAQGFLLGRPVPQAAVLRAA
jgi:diguanylate cyclase (GGDEF)-like protein